jgi:hypothetical protein
VRRNSVFVPRFPCGDDTPPVFLILVGHCW